MGSPVASEFNEGVEEFHYCLTGTGSDKYVAFFFKDNKVFSYSHHIKYLSKFHKLENNFILMIKKDLFETVGYIKFQEHMKKMFISIIIKKSYQQQGIGKQVLKILNLNKFSNKKFYAEVKKKNLKSINAFSKAGFIKNKNLKII